MIGATLFRYIFWRYLKVVFQFFLAITVVVYLIDFTEFARSEANSPNYNLSIAALLSVVKMPFIMQIITPFVILFAAMTVLTTLNRKHELVITRASGVSVWQFLMPLGVASFMIGIFAITVFNPVAAFSFSYARVLEAEIRGQESSNPGQAVPWLTQRSGNGLAIIGARNITNRGLDLRGVTVMQFDADGNTTERIEAARAVLKDGYWQLADVTRITTDGRRQALEEMQLDTSLRPEFVTERLADPDAISFFELPRMIEVARALGLQANAFATKLHSLFALPFLLVAMTLIAATFSMRFARMGQSINMILGGILAGFLLYVVTVMVTALGSAGVMPPPLAAWLPTMAAMLFGMTFLLFKEDG